MKCIHARPGLDDSVDEETFIEFVMTTLMRKTQRGDDKGVSENSYQYLSTLLNKTGKSQEEIDNDLYTFNDQIDFNFNSEALKNNFPKSLRQFRIFVGEYLQNKSCWAGQYDQDLIRVLCPSFKFQVIQQNVPDNFEMEEDVVYLLRVGEVHYNAIIKNKK